MASESGSADEGVEGTEVNVHALVEDKKASGNDKFREGDVEGALSLYTEAVQLLCDSGLQGIPLWPILASNQALCLLKLERFAEAEDRASAALVADPANSKAIYRRGVARLKLGIVQDAHDDLQKAVRLEPQNREIRERFEEAKRIAATVSVVPEEQALASGAAGALGMEAGGGLYGEKPDLNEGRLADTHREQRKWVDSISDWDEITDVCFSAEESKPHVSVYMGLPGVHNITPNKICVWFLSSSLEVRVIDLNGKNWFYMARELWAQIDETTSSYTVRKDKLSLKLQKRASARSWDKWEKLRRI